MKSKAIISVICFFIVVTSLCACNDLKEQSIIIENKSAFNYTDKVVSISWKKINEKYPVLDVMNFKIINADTKKEVPYQLEYAGSTNIQNVLIQINVKSKKSTKLIFENGKHEGFVTKTYARYVPERLDDFAWENDKIAFRMYGKALELEPKQNAYGIDVWVKRTARMIINERYKKGEYHVDHGDGLDYYHVGYTLGAGNMAPFINDSIWYSKNYTKWKILDNGPIRTTFQLEFDAWDVAGKKMTALKTISLDAGSQLNKIEVNYTYNDDSIEQLPMVVGIIKRPEAGNELFDKENGILGYWEPQHGNDGTTGIGVIIPTKVNNMQDRNNQLFAMLDIPNNKSFVYYQGAAWDKAGIITNDKEWFQYLSDMQQQLINDGISIRF